MMAVHLIQHASLQVDESEKYLLLQSQVHLIQIRWPYKGYTIQSALVKSQLL